MSWSLPAMQLYILPVGKSPVGCPHPAKQLYILPVGKSPFGRSLPAKQLPPRDGEGGGRGFHPAKQLPPLWGRAGGEAI